MFTFAIPPLDWILILQYLRYFLSGSMLKENQLYRVSMFKIIICPLCLMLALFSDIVEANNVVDNHSVASTKRKLTVSDFVGNARVSSIKVSPDGQHAAIVQADSNKSYLFVREYSTNKAYVATHIDLDKGQIADIEWQNNERLILWLMVKNEDEGLASYHQRILAVNFDGANLMELDIGKDRRRLWRFTILQLLPEDDKRIVVSFGLQSYYKLDTYSGEMEKLNTRAKKADLILYDASGTSRIAVYYYKKKIRIKSYNQEKEKWEKLWDLTNPDSIQDISFLGFDENSDHLYLSMLKDGRKALFRAKTSEEEFSPELMLEDDRYDVTGRLLTARKDGNVIGIAYTTDKPIYYYWHSRYRAVQRFLDDTLNDSTNRVISADEDGKKFVILSSNPKNPGSYHFLDLGLKRLTFIADKFPVISENLDFEYEKVIFENRDGLELDGFLLRPKQGADLANKAIIVPHGGPFSRDKLDYSVLNAFLANRGYIVFGLNFQGSLGYGKEFEEAGYKQWGGVIQDDIEDARRYLVREKIVDPKRICIVGGSFGGYSALISGARYNSKYKCVISFSGISNLKSFASMHRYNKSTREMIGNSWSDRKLLEGWSPVFMAENIDIPVLLIHGDSDKRVPYKHSKNMHNALLKAKKNSELIIIKGGRHTYDAEGLKVLLENTERFLEDHL